MKRLYSSIKSISLVKSRRDVGISKNKESLVSQTIFKPARLKISFLYSKIFKISFADSFWSIKIFDDWTARALGSVLYEIGIIFISVVNWIRVNKLFKKKTFLKKVRPKI